MRRAHEALELLREMYPLQEDQRRLSSRAQAFPKITALGQVPPRLPIEPRDIGSNRERSLTDWGGIQGTSLVLSRVQG